MKLLGFNFEKISIERLKNSQGEIKIKSNIDISEIKEMKADFLKSQENPLQIDFVYSVDYEPEVARIELKGTIILSVEEQQSKEILKDWKKKKTSEDFRQVVFNLILRKATIRALELEDEMNLPPHMPMPVLGHEKQGE